MYFKDLLQQRFLNHIFHDLFKVLHSCEQRCGTENWFLYFASSFGKFTDICEPQTVLESSINYNSLPF